MFEPKFIISNKMLEWVVVVEKTKQVVELVRLPEDWEGRMKLELTARKAVALMKHLGSQLNVTDAIKIISDDPSRDDKAEEVAKRVDVVGREIDIQMMMNWMNTNKYKDQMVYLSQKFHQRNLGMKELSQINSLWLERLVSPSVAGKYRNELSSDKLEGTGTEWQVLSIEVPHQVEEILAWLGSGVKRGIHPLFVAGLCLYEILRIKPFGEENLAVAVFVMNWVLEEEGFGMKGFLEVEEELLRNRESVWGHVDGVRLNGELTGWLEFFLKALAEASVKLRTKVMMAVGETPVFKTDSGKRVALSERQIIIMEGLTMSGDTTIKEVRALLPMVSDDTILRDLKDLMEKRLVKKKGRTRGAVYILGRNRAFGS